MLTDLELFLAGLIMAGSLYCDGSCNSDDDDFDLWRRCWDIAVPMWNLAAREQGWLAVGMSWEYHVDMDWNVRVNFVPSGAIAT